MSLQRVEVRGNGIVARPAKRDGNAGTARQFANSLFGGEYCHECHGDIKDHVYVVGPFGVWFAACRRRHVPDCKVCDKRRRR